LEFCEKYILTKWWHHCNIEKDGVFMLGCKGFNFDLVRHVVAKGMIKNEDFLLSKSNNILKPLEVAVNGSYEELALILLEL
jgi:hypothetical protein